MDASFDIKKFEDKRAIPTHKPSAEAKTMLTNDTFKVLSTAVV